MGMMAYQITSLALVYSTVYSGADQRKHQSSASLALVQGIHRWPVNSPHKWPVTPEIFPFDDIIMYCLQVRFRGFHWSPVIIVPEAVHRWASAVVTFLVPCHEVCNLFEDKAPVDMDCQVCDKNDDEILFYGDLHIWMSTLADKVQLWAECLPFCFWFGVNFGGYLKTTLDN